jgi:spore coat protein A
MKNIRISRRKFLQAATLGAAATALPLKWLGRGTAYAFYQSRGLMKFGPGQVLRGVGPGGIPVAAPDGSAAPVTGVTHYSIDIQQFTDQLHPDLDPTKLWGYNPIVPLGGGSQQAKHLGGILVADKGTPIQITFANSLPDNHIIPVDTTILGAGGPRNRTAIHLHGGFVPWISDGGPFDWWLPNGTRGPSFLNNQVLNPTAFPDEAEYYYPMDQTARMMWYHDHSFGTTRINAYAGLASACILRDNFERSLVGPSPGRGLPPFIETSVLGGTVVLELPVIVQDKIFVNSDNILALDPTWPGPISTGSLWYAHVYEPKLYKLTGNKAGKGAVPDPSVVPEFFGDTMLANGTVYPEATVEPRRYRLRALNACNARFLNLQLYVDDGSADGITLNPVTLAPTNAKGPDFLVLGHDGGFLPKAVLVPSNVPFNPVTLAGSLITGPAERWDLVVDFSGYAGQKVILYNDAPAPFPDGSPLTDYFPGAPGNPTITAPGFGPNTRQIMRFSVGTAVTAPADSPLAISPATDLTQGIDPQLVNQATGQLLVTPKTTRTLTLNESFDAFGRLIQFLGTAVPPVNVGMGFGRAYTDPATETPLAGDVEVWEIYNLTGDTHPIHFHLVNVQIINRQPFRVSNFHGDPASFLGPALPPDRNEFGWKETVRMNPGEVTRVIMRFTLPAMPFTVPASRRTGGNEYVWHCHILEHEEHDMMRPLVIG